MHYLKSPKFNFYQLKVIYFLTNSSIVSAIVILSLVNLIRYCSPSQDLSSPESRYFSTSYF